jgi:hypothetical protein
VIDPHATRLLSLQSIAARLNADELEALVFVAQKLEAGIAKHGHLDLNTDPRNWRAEAREEMADCALYFAFEAIKAGRAHEAARDEVVPRQVASDHSETTPFEQVVLGPPAYAKNADGWCFPVSSSSGGSTATDYGAVFGDGEEGK